MTDDILDFLFAALIPTLIIGFVGLAVWFAMAESRRYDQMYEACVTETELPYTCMREVEVLRQGRGGVRVEFSSRTGEGR